MKPYPVEKGLPINPEEMEFTVIHPLDEECVTLGADVNNHHRIYTLKSAGRLIITKVLRDLEGMQHIMPVDEHRVLHNLYTEPDIALGAAWRYIHEAYESNMRLRTGSARLPTWKPLTEIHMKQVDMEMRGDI